MKHRIVSLFFVFQLISANAQQPANLHEIFNRLLQKNVATDSRVNYRAFLRDSAELNRYLKLISKNPPDAKKWTSNEQQAYWINAYNAFTIQLILKHYPIKSIKDIGSLIQIPFVNTPWALKFFWIGSEKMSLDQIEHSILRKQFKDPRIHMALVCASKSCPKLLNEAYEAKRLNEQLDSQAKAFLTDPNRNKINPDKAEISKIFSWYSGDFEENGGSVKSFIERHSGKKLKPKAKISYLDYDWSLNE